MVQANDLEKMLALQGLDQSQLEKLATIADKGRYPADKVLFRHRERLTHYNLLLEGKVALTLAPEGEEPFTLEIIEPGRSFGISALIPGKRGSANAVCQEDSTVIHLPAKEMLELFEQDSDMGYRFMYRVLPSFKTRMHQRTRQYILSVEQHPEIQQALESLGHVFHG